MGSKARIKGKPTLGEQSCDSKLDIENVVKNELIHTQLRVNEGNFETDQGRKSLLLRYL
jgi:hypothetical protein